MISFNFMHLQCFITAAETGSFSAAGRLLSKAQSGVSTAVSNLEIDLGVQLFDRSRKYLKLTDEGKALLLEAKGVLKSGERLKDRAISFCAQEDTHIRLALDEALYSGFIETVLIEFERKFPFTELDLQSGVFNDVERYVAAGDADIGLLISVGIPQHTETYRLLSYVPFQAAASASHPIAQKEDVTVNDLAAERQLVVTSRGENKDTEVTHFSPKNWLVDSYSTCASLVQNGMGWAFFPTCMSKNLMSDRGIVPLSLELELREHASPLYLIRNTNKKFGKAGQWLLKQLGQHQFRQ
ncbi:LysR family transcriptional regulator [Maridesulfovibrio frigidus]|uniref:LysR family transcriptional regulator n=1 Tax=Maridesulfovibrio frigidus TaxID=340956 RepID=UPI0004E1C7F0|nr:LysR family transcriptional regulator [Maridesulfovibrio frigidus]